MPASSHHPGSPALPADATDITVRLVGGHGGFVPVESPALTLRRRLTDLDDAGRTDIDEEGADRWPPLVRAVLPVLLSIMLWGAILALILRR